MIFLGCAAFGLFFLNDLNDMKLHRRPFALCFPAGAFLLCLSALVLALDGKAPVSSWLKWALWAVFLLFSALELYTLFFAIPAGASYAAPGERRETVKTGVYALCRHPGVLWLAAVFFALSGISGFPLIGAALFTGLNVLLVLFEDAWVFPSLMKDYDSYKLETPFLIPNLRSLRRGIAYYFNK